MSLKLREAREEAGYTIDEVSQALNIRKQYIIYLEEGNFEKIPGKVYVDGYTKMYSEFLGIEVPDNNFQHNKPKVKINVNNEKDIKRKYVVFFSTITLIFVVLIYSYLRSSEAEIVEDDLIQSIQEQDGNNEEEFN